MNLLYALSKYVKLLFKSGNESCICSVDVCKKIPGIQNCSIFRIFLRRLLSPASANSLRSNRAPAGETMLGRLSENHRTILYARYFIQTVHRSI